MRIGLPARRSRMGDNMLPVINIVFLLLIFFMLLGALSRPDAFDVQPLQADGGVAADADADALVLGADGRMALGREPVAPRNLALAAANWQARHPGQPLRVKADANADAVHVVEVMETLRAAGIAQVELLSRPRGAAP